MSRLGILLAAAALFVGAIALSSPLHAQCVPGNFPANWLQQQENAGGHTIAQHVGQTDQQLMQRVTATHPPRSAGSFPAATPPAAAYSAAQTTLTDALASQRNAINNWANSANEGGRRAVAMTASDTIGRTVTAAAPTNVISTPYFCMVLQANGDGTCYLLTSFPTPAASGYCN